MVEALNPRYQLPHKDYFSGVEKNAYTFQLLPISGLHVPLSHTSVLLFTTFAQIGPLKVTACRLISHQKITPVYTFRML